uniref:SDR family NAD(P)-dependent oxidoreductase n=1 Tax=Acinetobacter baumannii TaxID=470 RepID=UPI001147A1B6
MAKLDTLQNKEVWITGASSGLGKAVAGELALLGAQVIVTSRRFEELEEVRVGLLHQDQNLSVVADIPNQEQAQEA